MAAFYFISRILRHLKIGNIIVMHLLTQSQIGYLINLPAGYFQNRGSAPELTPYSPPVDLALKTF